MEKEKFIESNLLKELLKKRIIGHGYKPLWKIIRFFPSEVRGDVKKVIKKLITKGLLLSFKSGNCISINNRALEEVYRKIEKAI